MELNFQTVIALLLVLGAAFYLVRHLRRSMNAKHDCPDCGIEIKKPLKKS